MLLDALRAAGADVRRHRDHFAPDAPDETWLPEVGHRGWVVLTKDKNIRRNELEREALLSANVRAFVLTSGSLTSAETAAVFVQQLRKMADMAVSEPPPFVASVTRTGVRIVCRR